MKKILCNLIDQGLTDSYLDNSQREELKELIKNIKEKYLYKSLIHGLHHSEKVLMFAYIISTDFEMSDVDRQILYDASLYHDIGRISDVEESFHGLNSARKIDEVVDNPIYDDQQNLNILKAICDGHATDDKFIERTAINYDISDDNLPRYHLLYKILKDADALDRTRFRKTSLAVLNEKYLRFDFSKHLVEFANRVNELYRNKISEINYEKFKDFNDSSSSIVCFHGIGFNFFNLESILKHGLLSNYAKLQKGIFNKRNFYGNNSELWISVTNKKGKATQAFIDNCISLELVVPKLSLGDKNKSRAFDFGLPYNSGEYDDEAFAFYEVPVFNIKKININPEILNTSISSLKYINGSLNIDVITDLVNEYLNKIRLLGFFPNIKNITEILSCYRNEVLNYERLNNFDQKVHQNQLFATCEAYLEKINEEIQIWMQQLYQRKFNKEVVTVGDVITDILNELNFNYELVDGSFVLNQGRQI